MPSAASLAERRYYAHPRNFFWPLMAAVLDEALPAAYGQRAAMLRRHHVALWDALASCVRPTSLDSAIRSEAPNDIAALLAAQPTITAVCFNGRKAEQACPDLPAGLQRLTLPSSSPVPTPAMRGFDDRLAAWLALRPLLAA
jgi:TDG/mug DNA glycosylase family protein